MAIARHECSSCRCALALELQRCGKAIAGLEGGCWPQVLTLYSFAPCCLRPIILQDAFYACKTCDKLYWEGPKSTNAFDHFSSLFDGMPAAPSAAK